ncbi:permease prefix domain 1-containing protein [Dactylosporangium sp. NPDC051541]|uniref:permease prefix domain 1-containing protein n=1 Tax=Dactylosporangium sp. NPDC051541 TaxID=3363977 RepID=UPI0037B2B305
MSDVERYLDELFDRLAGQGAAGRRMLEEAEQHLRLAVADRVAEGMPVADAEREAVARFGASGPIASLLGRVYQGSRLVRAVVVGGWVVLMLAGAHIVTALVLAEWGTSYTIMRQTAVIGVLLLVAGGVGVTAGRWAGGRPTHALLQASVLALAGVVVLVDVPLAVGLAFGEQGLHRHAAALLTGVAAANVLGVGGVRRLARRSAEQGEVDGVGHGSLAGDVRV